MRKDGFMKRRIMVIAVVSVIIAAAITSLDDTQAAAQDTVRSRGSLTYGDGDLVVIDGNDIRHLHEEIKDLFGELLEHYGDHNSLTEE